MSETGHMLVINVPFCTTHRYKTDVVEFVSTEHTPRNILIRSVKPAGGSAGLTAAQQQQLQQQREQAIEEYVALKEFWGVTPHLEELLAAELAAAGLGSSH